MPSRRIVAVPAHPVVQFSAFRRTKSELPSLLDLPHRVMTRSGRSAIVLALQLSGVVPGDRVLVPTYHCPTMIAPIEHLGARPAFYPLSETAEPNLEFLSQLDVSLVRAMLVAHLFGIPRPLKGVAEFCRDRGIRLIEDCAHCFYGEAGGAAVGTTGDFAIGSLPKFFPVVEGGMLAWSGKAADVHVSGRSRFVSELRAVWDLLELSARFGRLGILATPLVNALASARRHIRSVTPGAAAAEFFDASPESVRKVALLDPLLEPRVMRLIERSVVTRSSPADNCRKRRANFCELVRLLDDLRVAMPLHRSCDDSAAPYVMPLLVQGSPDRCYAHMRRLRLPVFRWDRVWPGTPSLACDVATQWSRGVVQIACHQSLTPSDIETVAKAVRFCISEAATAA